MSCLLSLLINAQEPQVPTENFYNKDPLKIKMLVFIVAGSCSCCKLQCF